MIIIILVFTASICSAQPPTLLALNIKLECLTVNLSSDATEAATVGNTVVLAECNRFGSNHPCMCGV